MIDKRMKVDNKLDEAIVEAINLLISVQSIN